MQNSTVMKLYTILVAATVAVMCAVSSCKAKVSACKTEDSDKITRVLAIGNSFSEDALDSYFHSICEAAGRKVIVGNLYIGGCPIDRHYRNAQTNEAAYRFRRIGLDGNIIESHDTRLGWAIGSDNWDIVTFQQASGVSGKYGSYAKLPPSLPMSTALWPTGPLWRGIRRGHMPLIPGTRSFQTMTATR